MKLSISTTHRETALGCIYLLFSLFCLSDLTVITGNLLGTSLSLAVVNILYFVINFICVTAIFHRFLWRSLKAAGEKPWLCLRSAALGFGFYYLASLLISFIILKIKPDFSNINDAFITDMAQEHTRLISFCTVFLAPVVEETLYRGLIFQQLQKKSRLAAYCVSVSVFAGIHIMNYIGRFDWLTLLLCFVQYLPAGIAFAWAYEKSDTIFTPILMHISINQIGIAALR